MRAHLIRSLFLLLFVTASRAATLHVSPSGNDNNPGTEAQPFATITRARDAIRQHSVPPPITVVIHRGTYRQAATLNLDARDSDTTWQAAANEEVHIDGGLSIDPKSFHPVEDQTILDRLSPAARDHVLVADLSALGVKSIASWPVKFRGGPAAPELFFNNQRMQIARWPNQGFASIDKVIDPGADPRDGDNSNRLPVFTVADPRPRNWKTNDGVWLYGHFSYDWYDEVIRVKSIDQTNGQITLAEPSLYSVKSGRFYAMNVLEELDSPGEYYIDAAHRQLYFWPPAPHENARIAISLLKAPLLNIDKAHNITFSGMTFENGLTNAIHVHDSTAVRIARCTIRNVTQQGIRVERGSDDVVDSCDIYDTGSGGIYLDGGDRRTLTPAHHLASNNRIHDFARLERSGSDTGAIALAGVGNRAAHNLIYNTTYQALWILGNDNIVEYNVFHHVVSDVHDAGAIYKGRNPSCRGNIIRYNFFHDIGDPSGWGTCAIYFDDGDGGDIVFSNIFLRCGYPGKWATWGTIFSHGGFDLRAENNIFIDCKCALGSLPWDDARWQNALDGGQDCHYPEKLLKEVDITSTIYTTRYPELIGFMHPKPGQPRISHARNNVLVRCDGIARGNWQSDPHTTWSTKDDPGFVDAAHDDFRQRTDAEIFHRLPEFKPIPFEQIGPQDR